MPRRRRFFSVSAEVRGFESAFDSDSGTRAALILDYAGAVGGQFYDGVSNTLTFDDLHTFTRASLATQRDTAGLVKFVPHNLFKGSEDFANATYWTPEGEASISSGVTDPTGGNKAVTFTEDTAASVHGLTAAAANRPGLLVGEIQQVRVYLGSAGTRRYVVCVVARGSDIALVTVDTQAGTITEAVDSGVMTIEASSISTNGNFYLVTFSFSTTVADTTMQLFIQGSDSETGNSVNPSYTGTSSTIIVWGGQYNHFPMAAANDTFAATYVPTTAAAVYQHRLDHDKDGNRIGLLLEEERTNLALQANGFATTWTRDFTATPTQTTTGPDGLTSGWLFKDDGSVGNDNVRLKQNFTVDTSSLYVGSVYAKKDQLDFLSLHFFDFTTPAGANAKVWFNLNTGATETVGSEIDASGMIDAGNGWFLCWAAITTDAIDTTGTFYIRLAEANGGNTVELDGTSSVFIYGAQFEEGVHPSSYIPTTTVAVTRADEVCSLAVADWSYVQGTSSWINEYDVIDAAPISTGHMVLSARGTGSTLIASEAKGSNSADAWFLRDAGAVGFAAELSGGNADTGVALKTAAAWATNDYAMSSQGLAVVTTAAGGAIAGVSTYYVGGLDGVSDVLNGHIRSLTNFGTRLSNADLVAGSV